MSLASVRATAREVRTTFEEAKGLRDQWDALKPLIQATHQNSEISREVLSRNLIGRLRWLLLGR